jgi:hypothetical protein
MSNGRSAATLVSSTRDLTLNSKLWRRFEFTICSDTNRYLIISRSFRHGIRAAGQLHRNLDGPGSAGEQYLGARGGPARVPLREYWPVPRRGSGHAGRPAVRRTQPECRFDKLCGLALPALERTTGGQRRAGDREPPPRPIGGDPFGRTGIPRKPGGVCSPPRRSSSTSVARPDSATTMPSSRRPWENSTSRNGLL